MTEGGAAIVELGAAAAAERVRSGELSRAELFDTYRDRAAHDDTGAFLSVAQAPNAPGEGPLAGVPLAVKDVFCVEGVESTAGSRILAGYRPPYTATAVARLAQAGAPMLGKTNMDEFAMGSSNENSAYGAVRNPWDPERVPGGSSGGSAAAVAGGSAPWAIGTDTGGSVRQPAALCGLVGLKPTYGSVSRYGMIAFASSFDQAGPITRDVTDAALLYRHMTGRDPCDSTSLDHPERIVLPDAERLDGLRFGVPPELATESEGIEPGVLEVLEAAIGRITELGGEVEEISLPHAEHGLAAYYVLAPAEASANLARYDGVRYGLRAGGSSDEGLAEMYERTRSEGFGDEVKRRVMLGTYALSAGYYEAYYGRAQRVRTKIVEDFARAFEDVDLVITPTSPTVAFKLGERTGSPLAMYMSDYCTVPMSLAGLPAISLPGGLSEGLPVGVQLAAPAFGENRLLGAARALERAIGFEGVPRNAGGAAGVPEPVAERRYEPVIGLEIHVQLSTRTKMFCGCELSFGEPPNTRTCPVCLGHPGVLPAVNAEAVHYGLMIGLALGCEIAPRSIFHRKNYFYPDLPKGYQVSQYDVPLARDGRLGDVRIHRAHLEEDAAKLLHAGASGRIHSAAGSTVDFNRGGTPLVEIVTEPDLRSAEQAADWLRLLRATLGRLGVSDVNMEEGSLRCDANVSIRPLGEATLGVKTELKNMNSFRFLQRGVEAELARQEEALREGGRVEPETLHFDPRSGALSPLRSKEEVQDYRYFPEPDLVPLAPTEQMLDRARAALPELPAQRAERFERDLGLAADTARHLAYRGELGDFFEAALAAADDGGAASADPRALASWVTVELVARLADRELGQSPVTPAALAKLAGMVSSRAISQSAAKQVLDALAEDGGDPEQLVRDLGLALAGGDELEAIVERAIAANEDAVDQVRGGNAKAIGAIMGPVMRETKGRADGAEVQRMIRERIGA